jgi:hypothetical protein
MKKWHLCDLLLEHHGVYISTLYIQKPLIFVVVDNNLHKFLTKFILSNENIGIIFFRFK